MSIADQHPRGAHFWVRAKDPDTVALRAGRVRGVVLMAESQSGIVARHDDLKRQADIARRAQCEIRVWALHKKQSFKDPEGCAERLIAALLAVQGVGVVPDLELACRGELALTVRFLRRLLDGLTEQHDIGITSYPIARNFRDMPWAAMRIGWGSPQIYDTAAEVVRATSAIEGWAKWWPDQPGFSPYSRSERRVVVPAMATYDTDSPGTGAEQVRGDLRRVCLDEHGKARVPGAIFWSLQQTDKDELKEIAVFSDEHWSPS